MAEVFRLLTVDDATEYHRVLVDGYAANKEFPISFEATDFTLQQSIDWVKEQPTYGLYVDDQLVSSISLRMPWIGKGTIKGFPHIGHFVTAPQHKGKGYAKKTLAYIEDLLRTVYRTPVVTLGTAAQHPWLQDMYKNMGFVEFKRTQLKGKKHITIFFEKNLI